MAVIEKSGLMKYKDKSGNTYLMYPITNTDNIDGLEEAIADVKNYADQQNKAFPIIATVSDDGSTITLDKTYQEISVAIASKKNCYVFAGDYNSVYRYSRTLKTRTGNKFLFSRFVDVTGNDIWSSSVGSLVVGSTSIYAYNATLLTETLYRTVADAETNGLMSSTDKSKLDGIDEGANKTTVDSAMSTTSENPVQNKVIAAAIDSAIQSAIQNTWEASY